MVAWNLAVFFIEITLLTGHTEGREYAEQIAPLDFVVLGGLVAVAINAFRTVQNRREKQLYISLWYFMGTFLWFPLVYLIGNRTFIRLSGLNDAAVNWFYGHNVLGLWFTTLGIGVTYYLVPIISRAPLFSHKLSLIGFWSIAMVYAPTGAHHLLQAPIPEWLKSAAIVSSLLLLIPVFAAVTNFFVTVRGRFDVVMNNIALRWTITGVVNYLLTCLQGPFQAARPVNWYVHFTNWVVAHALLGSFGFFVYGATYHMVPRITGRRLYSVALAEAHYWLVLIGFILFFFALTMAGLEQASMWNLGVPEYQAFIQLYPLMVLRFLGGVMMFTGHCIFAWLLLRTVTARQPATPTERAMVDAIVPPPLGQ
jgi:cbb3-type cytochrome c oxidase subunit I